MLLVASTNAQQPKNFCFLTSGPSMLFGQTFDCHPPPLRPHPLLRLEPAPTLFEILADNYVAGRSSSRAVPDQWGKSYVS